MRSDQIFSRISDHKLKRSKNVVGKLLPKDRCLLARYRLFLKLRASQEQVNFSIKCLRQESDLCLYLFHITT
jgi:hypothetical protein